MKRFLRVPSAAMVVAIVALVVASSGVSYAVATISGSSLVNGSVRNAKFKDGTLRGQEAKRDGFGGGSIKEQSLDTSKLDASKLGPVPSAGAAEGLVRHVVVASNGSAVPGRGVTSTAKTGVDQIPGHLRPRRAQLHVLRDARRRIGGGARHRPDLGDLGGEQRERRAGGIAQQRRGHARGPVVPSDGVVLVV
jgi:hypothetical protein